MNEPVWLDRMAVDAMHYDLLQRHGGLAGIRDDDAVESALARPRHKWTFESGADLCALAAAYGYGLARHHGYSDGNKRIAFMAMYTFLGVNGLDIMATEVEVVQLMVGVAAQHLDEEQLAAWLREHVTS